MAQDAEVRRPAVAGQFYSGSPTGLRKQIEECYLSRLGPGELPIVRPDGPRQIVGLVSPHAGYMYSGPTAAHGFYHLASDGIPEVLVIVGPCHQRAAMVPAAIQTHGAWLTPLGQTPIDTDAATAIAQAWDGFGLGARYFWAEHSLEVQLPFLQHLYGERLRIVPVLIVDQNNYTAREVGRALAEGLQGRDAVIVASTDLSHYVPAAVAEHRDGQLIDRILALDPEGLMRLAREPQMSMCGFGPVAAMLHAATALGAQQAIKLSYTHSGMTYPAAEVVGYVSIMIRR